MGRGTNCYCVAVHGVHAQPSARVNATCGCDHAAIRASLSSTARSRPLTGCVMGVGYVVSSNSVARNDLNVRALLIRWRDADCVWPAWPRSAPRSRLFVDDCVVLTSHNCEGYPLAISSLQPTALARDLPFATGHAPLTGTEERALANDRLVFRTARLLFAELILSHIEECLGCHEHPQTYTQARAHLSIGTRSACYPHAVPLQHARIRSKDYREL